MDLTHYSTEELHSIQADIDKELNARRKEDRRQALAELKDVAKRYGFSVDELVRSGTAARGGSAGKTVRFRHPSDPSLTWGGRGRKPEWVRQWEEAGRTIEECRV